MTNKKCMGFSVAALIVSGALVGCDKTPKPKAFFDATAEATMQKSEVISRVDGVKAVDNQLMVKARG